MQVIRTRPSKWLLCLAISFCALAMTYWPDGLLVLRYDRIAISSGQVWRFVTGHLVHLNTPHLLFNLLGLFLLSELLWGQLPVWHGLAILVASAIGSSALLWQLHPELVWYAGLSGTLHGLWAGCVLSGILQSTSKSELPLSIQSNNSLRNRLVSQMGMLLLIAKLGIEWRYGTSARTEQAIGAPVVAAAHLYGALIGSAYILIWRIFTMFQSGNHV